MDAEIKKKAEELCLQRMEIAIEQGVTDEGKQATKEAMEVLDRLNQVDKNDSEKESKEHNIWYEVVIPVGKEVGKFVAYAALAVWLTNYEKKDIVTGQSKNIFSRILRID